MNTKQLAYNRPDVPLDVVRQLRHQLVLAAGDVKRYEQFSRNEWIATPAAEETGANLPTVRLDPFGVTVTAIGSVTKV